MPPSVPGFMAHLKENVPMKMAKSVCYVVEKI